MARKRLSWVLAAAALAGLAGCGSPAAGGTQQPPARIERVAGGVPSVVLSRVGAERLGLRTISVQAAQGGAAGVVVIPYAALLYEPDGSPVVYQVTGSRTYTRRHVSVSKIADRLVYVGRGLAPGAQVVTAGAEELLGVEDGVGVQT